MKKLTIIRGVSGSGKTTVAREFAKGVSGICLAADDYFYDMYGGYHFDVDQLGAAHKWCQEECERAMKSSYIDNVIIHNTNTSEKELKPYLELAEEFNFKVISLIVENRHGGESVHDVPEETLVRQEARLRNSIKLR